MIPEKYISQYENRIYGVVNETAKVGHLKIDQNYFPIVKLTTDLTGESHSIVQILKPNEQSQSDNMSASILDGIR